MLIFVPKEAHPGERRTALIPVDAAKLVKLGAALEVEAGLGESVHYEDKDYTAVGASISTNRRDSLDRADLVLRLRKPPLDEIDRLKSGACHISYLDPFHEQEIVRHLADRGVSAFSMDMVPRSSLAQKMDALSSQANLAGYIAVIIAAERLDRILPMMMTPAGTINASRVFVVGAGVAGLQAIATARRLGARVEAFDTRAVVEEQVQSLGAKFVKIDLGETGQTKDGYARGLTDEQIAIQRREMARVCANSDVVITTAQVFGREAPRIITHEMVVGMRPGSVIVDCAVETGGNVEGSKLDEEVIVNGVRIIGLGNLPGRVPVHASQVYSSNLSSLVTHFWNKETKSFVVKPDDEIMRGCLITHAGRIVHDAVTKHYERGAAQ